MSWQGIALVAWRVVVGLVMLVVVEQAAVTRRLVVECHARVSAVEGGTPSGSNWSSRLPPQ